MYYQIVFELNEDENDPCYRIRPEVRGDAHEDSTVAVIDPALAEQNGIALDNHGFPTSESLEAWHKKNNPHLFTE